MAEFYLILAFVLFSIGIAGVILRKNLVIILISLEIMLNAINLALVSISIKQQILDPQVIVLLILGVAASEVAIGLAIMINLVKVRDSSKVDLFNLLKAK